MAGLSERTSNYLSARSADVVLSEIRPTKLSSDALKSVNVLLDEVLWMILSSARSFSTEQLKGALNKVLPTPLGKEALLEAEVELRAYWDRTTSNTSAGPYVENTQDFPLQPAYELLRLKCEAYSTFNDTDEDTDIESRWQMKVENAAGFSPHNAHFIAPAALYLTAIIEHVCEHILSNTGRVAARDSSRTIATLQDLYVALCEDDTIYGLFKVMKVHDQIEMQSKAMTARPQRSKSISRSISEHARTPSRGSASPFGSTANNEAGRTLQSKMRLSSDSAGSGTVAVPSSGSRPSIEKSKAKKLFGRASADKEGSQNGHGAYPDSMHKRTDSLLSNGKRSATPLGDGPGSSPSANEESLSSNVEFDELMRSGTTMKVSLTPDRLKTFEVYNKEKGRREVPRGAPLLPTSNLSHLAIKASNQPQDSSADNSASDDLLPDAVRDGRQATSRTVDAIVEDEEIGVNGLGGESNGTRTRKKSRGPPPVSYEAQPPITSRTRSMSASQSSISSSLGSRQVIGRKASLGAIAITSSQSNKDAPPVALMPKVSNSISSMVSVSGGGRGMRDSIDDILDGSSDDDGLVRAKNSLKPKAASGGTSTTRDLISFLNEGPPDMPRGLSQSVNLPPAEHRAKQGRFRSMVSRLTRGASSEKLSSSSNDDLNSPTKRNLYSSPPSFVPPPLSAKKSLRNISTYVQNQTSQYSSLPPPPLPAAPVTLPLTAPFSPPSSPNNRLNEPAAISPSRSRPAQTSTRKAVPPVFISSNIIAEPETTFVPPAPPKRDDAPPTPTRTRSEMRQDVKSPTDSSSLLSVSDEPVVRPKRLSSLDAGPPPKRSSRGSGSSRHAQRHALTPPSTPSIFATHAKDLRRLMAIATSADECRLLVDMFLAQSGIPMKASDFPTDPSLEPTEQHQAAVVEALLSNGTVLTEDADDRQKPLKMEGGTTPESLSNLPTPRSISHSPMTTIFRKPVPVVSHDVLTPVVASAVVSAEA